MGTGGNRLRQARFKSRTNFNLSIYYSTSLYFIPPSARAQIQFAGLDPQTDSTPPGWRRPRTPRCHSPSPEESSFHGQRSHDWASRTLRQLIAGHGEQILSERARQRCQRAIRGCGIRGCGTCHAGRPRANVRRSEVSNWPLWQHGCTCSHPTP